MAQDPPAGLDPACVDDLYEAILVNQLFDGLLTYDAHLNTVPCIASSWVISPDGRSYTFQLRKGVHFHDGSELTAEDVVYSLTRVFNLPESESSLARTYLTHILGTDAYARGQAHNVAGLEVLAPHMVRITLSQSYSSFLAVLASELARIVPKHYAEQVGREEFARHPIGSGPFRLAEWVPGERIVLTRFPNYTFSPAWLDSLVFELPSVNARDYATASFLDGRLSAVVIPDGRLHEFVDRPSTHLLTRQELSLMFLGLNARIRPFDDVRVRQAFALAIDRDALIRNDRQGRIMPNGILPPGMPGYTPESKLLAYDPGRARQLLADAGYPGGKGLPPIVYTSANQSQQARTLFEQIRQQVSAVGFELRLERLAWREFSHGLTNRLLQCLSVTWVADIPDPDSFLFAMCRSDGSANFTAYSNDEVDGLLLQGRATRSALQRLEVYRDAERRILQDASIVPLFHPLSAVALQANVRGMNVSAMGVANVQLEKVWLAPPAGAAAETAQKNEPAGTAAPGRGGAQPPTTRGVLLGRMP